MPDLLFSYHENSAYQRNFSNGLRKLSVSVQALPLIFSEVRCIVFLHESAYFSFVLKLQMRLSLLLKICCLYRSESRPPVLILFALSHWHFRFLPYIHRHDLFFLFLSLPICTELPKNWQFRYHFALIQPTQAVSLPLCDSI